MVGPFRGPVAQCTYLHPALYPGPFRRVIVVRSVAGMKKIGLWVLQVIAALTFLLAAVGKFTGAEPSASTFEAIGWGVWFRHLVGVVEVAGGAALLVPALAGVAAMVLAGLMAGAVVTEAFVSGGPVAVPLVLLVVSGLIAWGRSDRTAVLWERVARDGRVCDESRREGHS